MSFVNCLFDYGNYKIEIVVVCVVGANAGLCCVLLGMLFGGYASVPEIILFAFLS